MNIIFNRRHAEYLANEMRWRRSRDAYRGGREYIATALIRHLSEIDVEFQERQARAYDFNYPRAIARRITQHVLGVDPVRRGAAAELVEDWSRTGLRANEVMRQLSTMLNVYGRAWLLVESPEFSGDLTVAEAKRRNLRPYVTALSPLEVTDWAFGADGRLEWAIVAEETEEKSDPFAPARRFRRRRLYERTRWRLFGEGDGGVTELGSGVNPLGEVPLVQTVEPDGFGMAAGPWFEDVVRISEAILNNESEAQMNVVKQMFGMLVVPDSFARGVQRAAAMPGGREGRGLAATVARSAAVIESVEEKGLSRFISPSGIASETIRQENLHLKRELYDVVGLAVQSASREAQTAESKEWDFQNVGQFLAARADLLEQSEQAAWRMIHAYDPAAPVPEVVYNRKFAVRDLEGSISGLLKLTELSSGRYFRRAVRRAALELLDAVSGIPEEEKQQIQLEIDADGGAAPQAKEE